MAEEAVPGVEDTAEVDEVALGVGSSVGSQSSVSVGTELVAEAVVEEPPMEVDDVRNWPPGGPEEVVEEAVPGVLAELVEEAVPEVLAEVVEEAVPEVLAEVVD